MDRTMLIRERRQENPTPFSPGQRVLAVTSGKGGVGKTNVVANLAIALAQTGKRVLVLDADLGLGNLDVLLGLVPTWTLEHVLHGQKHLPDVILHGPQGIRVLPASSGSLDLTSLTWEQQLLLQDELEQVSRDVDLLLIDTGAGISPNVMFFAVAAQETLVVVTPEPTSLTDGYALMKVLSKEYAETRFRLLVNLVRSPEEATAVYRRLCRAADRFLNISIDFVGWVPADDYVPLAVCQQRAVVDRFPQAPASRAFHRLAASVGRWKPCVAPKGSVQFFWQRLVTQA